VAEFEVFVRVLIAIAAGIVAIGGAWTFIEHLGNLATTKQNRVAEQVAEHTRLIEKHAEYLDSDNKRLKEMEDSNRLIMRGMMTLMTHEIDGNHADQLAKTRDEIQEYLISK
jgi:hypothetical protein